MDSSKACTCRLPGQDESSFDAEKEEKLIREHTGLVKSVALRLSYVCDEELDDLIQIGYIGLIKAARRFEPERGQIRSQLRDRGTVKVSRGLKSDAAAVRRAESDFISRKGISPKLSELSEMTGLSRERVSEALMAADAMKNFEDYEKADLWTDNEDINITRIDLKKSVSELEPRQRQVILLRYYRDLTQQQVADIMGLSQVQIHRIEKNTLKELAEKV